MLKICTVFFDGLYHPNTVTKLYRSLKENSSVPFEFICLSDREKDFDGDPMGDVVLPYNHHSKIVSKPCYQLVWVLIPIPLFGSLLGSVIGSFALAYTAEIKELDNKDAIKKTHIE